MRRRSWARCSSSRSPAIPSYSRRPSGPPSRWLPVRFADTFLSFGELLDRRHSRTVGLALPIAILLMIAFTHGRLSVRAWLLVTLFVACLAIQTRPLYPVAAHIPILSYSLFVWRLMLPTAAIGFGALLPGWPASEGCDRMLAAIALPSLANLLVMMTGAAPAFAELTTGVATASAYMLVPSARSLVPSAALGIVDYTVNGSPVPVAACRGDMILGPLMPGAIVQVHEGKLAAALHLRIACLVIAVLRLSSIAARNR